MELSATTREPVALAHRLDALLSPRSIALVGASARPDSNGLALVQMSRIDGYAGKIFPVNPRYREIEGLACYPTLADLPERAEHVVLSLPATELEAGLAQAIAHGAKAATIFGSCQIGDDATPPLAERLRRGAVAADLALCGGNSMGFYNRSIGLRVASFPSPPGLRAGGIAFIAQSGSAFSALAHNDRRLGFSLCMSSGMELTTTAADYVEWALTRPETRVIGLFLEQVREPRRFIAALEAASMRDVPVVILKVGRTARSAAMAFSHTGAMAGNDIAFGAMCRRYDAIAVDDLDELATTLQFFDQRHRPGPGRLASIHDFGGEREMVVDIADRIGVEFADITATTRSAISPHLDTGLAADNPLDAWGTARDFVDRYAAAFGALVADPGVAAGVFFTDVREGYWYSAGLVEATTARRGLGRQAGDDCDQLFEDVQSWARGRARGRRHPDPRGHSRDATGDQARLPMAGPAAHAARQDLAAIRCHRRSVASAPSIGRLVERARRPRHVARLRRADGAGNTCRNRR